jgi:hypothetical protein
MNEPQEMKLIRDQTIRKLRENIVSIGDVPLSDASLCWYPEGHLKYGAVGRILVVPQSRINAGEDLFTKYDLPFAIGACLSEWAELSDTDRMLWLCTEAQRLVLVGSVGLVKAHQALLSIPEYRKEVSGEGMSSSGSHWFATHVPHGCVFSPGSRWFVMQASHG